MVAHSPAATFTTRFKDRKRPTASICCSLPQQKHAPHTKRLFHNFKAVEKEYFHHTTIFPIMHLLVLGRAMYEKHRLAASSLYEALNESKQLAWKSMEYTSALHYMLPWLPEAIDEIDEVFGGDCWPYGLEDEGNWRTVEALVQALWEQGMVSWSLGVDELFAPLSLTRFMMGLNDSLPMPGWEYRSEVLVM